MPMEIAVSIVIVNWNAKELLLDCVKSIRETTGDIACEVIVVDNASSDGSMDAVRERFPDVVLLASKANLGFAAGNNLGLSKARGEFVLLLNPDTVVKGTAIQDSVDFLREHPEAGAVGCRLLGSDGLVQESHWAAFPSLPWLLKCALYLNKLARRQSHETEAPVQVAHLLGAYIMARRSLMKKLNGFDESYFLYLEETDLCYRIREAGFSIYYLPGTGVIHYGQQSSNQVAEWANVQLSLSTYKFMREHGSSSLASRMCLQSIMLLGAFVRLLLWVMRFVLGRASRGHALKMLRGYWRLLWSVGSFESRYKNGYRVQ